MFAWVLGLLLTLSAPRVAEAQTPYDLEVWMMTFGAGEPVFLKFGHNAMLVRGRDPATGAIAFERVYDYGLFDGSSPTLVADFLQGRMRYWMGVTTLARTMRRYRMTNRDVFAQKLRLTPEQASDLFARLQDNAKPANRFYRYDYYYDNCSTRVRDVINVVTDGAVKAAFTGPAALTLRDHTLRHTATDWLYYLGLDLGLANVDQPIDVWVEAFLPFKLQESLRQVEIDVHGQRQPLVERDEVWFEGTRPQAPETPPDRWPVLLVVGLIVGGLMAIWGFAARQRLWLRRAFMVVASIIGVVFGFFGILLLFLWGFTDHTVAYANENIMQLAPWTIVAPVAAVWSRQPGRRTLYFVFVSALAFSALGLVVKVVPGFDQQTHRLIALLLPIWCGLGLGAHWVASRSSPADQ